MIKPDGLAEASCKELGAALEELRRVESNELSLSIVGLNNRQLSALAKCIEAGAELGYAFIQEGVTRFAQWAKTMREILAKPLNDAAGFTDAEIDDFIQELWDSPIEDAGRTMRLREWAAELGEAATRELV